MRSNVPVYKQFAYESLIPQGIFLIVLSLIANYFGLNKLFEFDGFFASILWGAIGQTIVWYAIRYFVLKYHKQGMIFVKEEKYAEAIPFFKDSYEIFSKYSWLDKYRYFLISTSKMEFREIDLNNIAFCYGQIGDKENSIKYYRRTLEEYPNNGLAKAALKFVETIEPEN